MANSYSGKFRTPEYIAWQNAIHRCEDSSRVEYPRYGGRGIKVCDEWRRDFAAFLAHLGSRPTKDHSLDRIDYDGHYEPGNVRWATWTEQQRNRCDNRRITAFGKTLCLQEWALETGLKRETIARRLNVGESPEKALRQETFKAATFEYRGEWMTLTALAELTGIPSNSLMRRIRRHGDVATAIQEWHRNIQGKKMRVA